MTDASTIPNTGVEGKTLTESGNLLEATDLKVTFRAPGGRKLHAVDTISIGIKPRETVGLVGESGSGKSTVALTLMRAHEPESGQIIFDGLDITHLSEKELLPIRRKLQVVFQDPYSSLDPRMTVRRIVAEPLKAHKFERGTTRLERLVVLGMCILKGSLVGTVVALKRLFFERRKPGKYHTRAQINDRVDELLDQVGLPPDAAQRLPAQFSGGQRQRIAIARSLALEPMALIADEPVSALDVSIQAQIVNLLRSLQDRLSIAFLVIAHDLALVHQICDRIVVMYLGEAVEEGPADDVVGRPQHPYTVALLSATPVPVVGGDAERILLTGDPPSPIHRPTGCRFHPRCPIAQERCKVDKPPFVEFAPGRKVSCFYAGQMDPPRDLWAHEKEPLPDSPED